MISRPCDENKRFLPLITPNEEECINIEAPTSLQTGTVVPVQPSAETFILLSPADLQNVTQKVLETEYQTGVGNDVAENDSLKSGMNLLISSKFY